MTSATKRSPGRPRPYETIRRDELIVEQLRTDGPATCAQLAYLLDETHRLTYSALCRLRAAGLVVRSLGDDGESIWVAREQAR